MFIRVEPDAQKTKEYLQYILREILRRSPLRIGKIINVKFVEGKAPFPEITEIPERGVTARDVLKQIDNDKPRREQQCGEITSFTENQLCNFCDLWSADGSGKYPMTITFRFMIRNIDQLCEKARKVGIATKEIYELTGKDLPSVAEFNIISSQLLWRGEITSIPPDTVQYCLCKIAFEKKPMEKVSWDEVAAEKEGVPEREVNQNWRRIYDAMKKVNIKTKDAVGKELFEWANKGFRRKE